MCHLLFDLQMAPFRFLSLHQWGKEFSVFAEVNSVKFLYLSGS